MLTDIEFRGTAPAGSAAPAPNTAPNTAPDDPSSPDPTAPAAGQAESPVGRTAGRAAGSPPDGAARATWPAAGSFDPPGRPGVRLRLAFDPAAGHTVAPADGGPGVDVLVLPLFGRPIDESLTHLVCNPIAGGRPGLRVPSVPPSFGDRPQGSHGT